MRCAVNGGPDALSRQRNMYHRAVSSSSSASSSSLSSARAPARTSAEAEATRAPVAHILQHRCWGLQCPLEGSFHC